MRQLHWELAWIDSHPQYYATPVAAALVQQAIARRYFLNHFTKLIRNPN